MTFILAPTPSTLDETPSLNLLPFTLTPTPSTAPISTYFHTRSSPTGEAQLASFRGRQVVGQRIDVPSGYRGVVLRVDTRGGSGVGGLLTPAASVFSNSSPSTSRSAAASASASASGSRGKYPLTPAASMESSTTPSSTPDTAPEAPKTRERVKGSGQVALSRPRTRNVRARAAAAPAKRFKLDSDDDDDDEDVVKPLKRSKPVPTPRTMPRTRSRGLTTPEPQTHTQQSIQDVPVIQVVQATPAKPALKAEPAESVESALETSQDMHTSKTPEGEADTLEMPNSSSRQTPLSRADTYLESEDRGGPQPQSDSQSQPQSDLIAECEDDTTPARILRPVSRFESFMLWTPDAGLAGFDPREMERRGGMKAEGDIKIEGGDQDSQCGVIDKPDSRSGTNDNDSSGTNDDSKSGTDNTASEANTRQETNPTTTTDKETPATSLSAVSGWWRTGGAGEGGDEFVRALGEWLGLNEIIHEPTYLDDKDEDEDD